MTASAPGHPARAVLHGRLQDVRRARRLSVDDAVALVRTCSGQAVPGDLAARWADWERGRAGPDAELRHVIAAALGMRTSTLFGPDAAGDEPRPDTDVVTRLCRSYSRRPADVLAAEAAEYLATLDGAAVGTEDRQLAACRLHLLLGHLHHDLDERPTCAIHLRIGTALAAALDEPAMLAWAHDLSAACAMTAGNFRTAVDQAAAGRIVAAGMPVAGQLLGQEARGWARLGQHRPALQALDAARAALDGAVHAADHLFVAAGDRFDDHAMEVHRILGDDLAAESFARIALADRSGCDPVREAHAHLTRAVVAARGGAAGRAIHHAYQAAELPHGRGPAFTMVVGELLAVLTARWPRHPEIARLRAETMPNRSVRAS